jgi:putative Mn2+ efflux pump MntP
LGPVELVSIALALGTDAAAVSLAAAAAGFASDRRAAFRLWFHFGLFQFLMPLLGWGFGTAVAAGVELGGRWLAGALLALVAFRMLRSGLGAHEPVSTRDPSRGLTMVGLSVATSLDALAVGLSLAALGVPVFAPAAVIGLVTAAMCLAAIIAAKALGPRTGRRGETVGGILLVLVALKIVLSAG